jgi:metal-responsive CopG/Arc/MetJ family transcriptional regulator
MDSPSSYSPKMKVSTSLDAELVKAIDELLKKSKARSRSQLIEDVLRSWYKQQKKRELESQIEEYYLSLSDEEQQEDRDWDQIAAKSAHRLWEDPNVA